MVWQLSLELFLQMGPVSIPLSRMMCIFIVTLKFTRVLISWVRYFSYFFSNFVLFTLIVVMNLSMVLCWRCCCQIMFFASFCFVHLSLLLVLIIFCIIYNLNCRRYNVTVTCSLGKRRLMMVVTLSVLRFNWFNSLISILWNATAAVASNFIRWKNESFSVKHLMVRDCGVVALFLKKGAIILDITSSILAVCALPAIDFPTTASILSKYLVSLVSMITNSVCP